MCVSTSVWMRVRLRVCCGRTLDDFHSILVWHTQMGIKRQDSQPTLDTTDKHIDKHTHKRISLEHCCKDECLYISGSTSYRLRMPDKNTFSFTLIFHDSLLVWNDSMSFNAVMVTALVHNTVFCICLSAMLIVQVSMLLYEVRWLLFIFFFRLILDCIKKAWNLNQSDGCREKVIYCRFKLKIPTPSC